MNETRFGALEITTPTIYETPINGMQLVRVDTLECLRELLGDDCLCARNTTYSVVSGSCESTVWQARMASYYRKYPKVTIFINKIFEYGDISKPLGEQVSQSLMEMIQDYSKELLQKFDDAGGKFLVSTHCYLYFKFAESATVPEVEGVKLIC